MNEAAVAKKKEKTRVTVKVGKQESQLFSFEIRKSGDLVILPSMGDYVEETPVKNDAEEANEYRISAHVSPQSPGNLFVQHLRTPDHRHRRWYARVEPKDGFLIWPMLSHLMQNPSLEKYALRSRAFDTVIRIDEFDPLRNTLVFHILVSKGQSNVRIESLNVKTIRTGYFDIHVYWGYFRAPSTFKGFSVFPWNCFWEMRRSIYTRERERSARFTSLTMSGIASHLAQVHDQMGIRHLENSIQNGGRDIVPLSVETLSRFAEVRLRPH